MHVLCSNLFHVTASFLCICINSPDFPFHVTQINKKNLIDMLAFRLSLKSQLEISYLSNSLIQKQMTEENHMNACHFLLHLVSLFRPVDYSSLYIGRAHFHFQGTLVYVFHSYLDFLFFKNPVCKQCRPWSGALCGVWSGSKLFARDARHERV